MALLVMPVVGFGMMVQMASSNTLLQTLADEDKRGRVMSLHTMALMGTLPFGSLMAGGLASQIGAPATVRVMGCCCLVAISLFARQLPRFRTLARPIYTQLGILPEVAPVAPPVE
jgi:predicted MFS family arabinose efflux permease